MSVFELESQSVNVGATVTIPVYLTASQDDMALFCGVRYNPSLLEFVSASLGSGAPAGAQFGMDARTSPGLVAFNSYGYSPWAGRREAFQIKFKALQAGIANITLDSGTTMIGGGGGNIIPVTFQDASVVINAVSSAPPPVVITPPPPVNTGTTVTLPLPPPVGVTQTPTGGTVITHIPPPSTLPNLGGGSTNTNNTGIVNTGAGNGFSDIIGEIKNLPIPVLVGGAVLAYLFFGKK